MPVVLVATARPAGEGDFAVGRVVSPSTFAVSAETGGRVLQLQARVGDRVRKAQALATFDATAALAQGAAARADLARAERAASERRANLDRVGRLRAAGVASQAELDAAGSEAAAAEAAITAARSVLDMARKAERDVVLRAPADGVIGARRLELSQVVAPGTLAFELDGEGGALEIEATLPEKTLAGLTGGGAVRFTSGEGDGEARFAGAPRRTEAGGARLARFRVTRGAVLPGAAVELHLSDGQGESGALVPLGAVQTARDGAKRVLIVGKSVLQARPVTLASVSGTGARVLGVRPGETVVAAGGEFLAPGSRVRAAFTLR